MIIGPLPNHNFYQPHQRSQVPNDCCCSSGCFDDSHHSYDPRKLKYLYSVQCMQSQIKRIIKIAQRVVVTLCSNITMLEMFFMLEILAQWELPVLHSLSHWIHMPASLAKRIQPEANLCESGTPCDEEVHKSYITLKWLTLTRDIIMCVHKPINVLLFMISSLTNFTSCYKGAEEVVVIPLHGALCCNLRPTSGGDRRLGCHPVWISTQAQACLQHNLKQRKVWFKYYI